MSLRPVLQIAPRPARDASPPPTFAVQPSIESNSLLRGTREVLIRHGGEIYRLRHTRNDKLILTK